MANRRYPHRICTNDPSRIRWQIRGGEYVYWRHVRDCCYDGVRNAGDGHRLTSCTLHSPNSSPSHRVWCPWDGTSYDCCTYKIE